jgi:hypothetical protein
MFCISIVFLDIMYLLVFILIPQRFGDWFVSIFRWDLLRWVQSIELTPISGPKITKSRTMHNAPEHNNCANISSSETFRSYVKLLYFVMWDNLTSGLWNIAVFLSWIAN